MEYEAQLADVEAHVSAVQSLASYDQLVQNDLSSLDDKHHEQDPPCSKKDSLTDSPADLAAPQNASKSKPIYISRSQFGPSCTDLLFIDISIVLEERGWRVNYAPYYYNSRRPDLPREEWANVFAELRYRQKLKRREALWENVKALFIAVLIIVGGSTALSLIGYLLSTIFGNSNSE